MLSRQRVDQLTFDTDLNRVNSHPSIILDIDGRAILFYQKTWYSGRTSDSRVTFIVGGFNVQVAAGSGTINSVSRSWLATNFTVGANSYELVYIDDTNTVKHTTNVPMLLLQDVIILAFVSSGATSIVRLEEVEKTGNYIFSRRQVNVGGQWTWDDYEYRLNTGEEPFAFYDRVAGKIYLTYRKDSRVFTRMFDLIEPLTWEFLPHFQINSGVINMYSDPVNSYQFGVFAGDTGIAAINTQDLFPLSNVGLGFAKDGGVFKPHYFVPTLSSVYSFYFPYYIEIVQRVGDVYTIIETLTVSEFDHKPVASFIWNVWNHAIGTVYFRVRLNTTLFQNEYVTDPINYKQLDIWNPFIDSYSLNVNAGKEIFRINTGAGPIATYTKTFEYTELRDYESDSYNSIKTGAGPIAVNTKTFEYSELRDFESDSYNSIKISVGPRALVTIT